MAKKPLILVVSDRMNTNKKEDRNENGLVRMSASAREYMDFPDIEGGQVELFKDEDAIKRINSAILLSVFKSFKEDNTRLKKMIADGEISQDDINRVGFVTAKTYERLVGNKGKKGDIWISDSVEATVIGADPEFLLFNTDGLVIKANSVGMGMAGPLGYDGAMAELRPDPSITPEGLVDNIKTILSKDKNLSFISKYDWKSGCYHKESSRDYPIGGHIHIGNPAQLLKIKQDDRMVFFKTFNKILDELLSLPMIRLDGDNGCARRTKSAMGRYGYFGEMRLSAGHLEHRTLSGLWLSHPELAKCVFGTAKAIIDEVFRYASHNKFKMDYISPRSFAGTNLWGENFSGWGDIPLARDLGCVRPSSEMINLLNKSSLEHISAKFLKDWYAHMRGLSTYGDYSQYIDGLYTILKTNNKKIHTINTNIKVTWLEKAEIFE
jgi:hypothetical protein